MGLEVDVAPPAVGDMRVALGRAEIGVPEHLLHGTQVGAALEEVRRERVSEEMGVDATGLEAGALGQLAQDEKGPGARQRATASVQEELRPVAPVEVGATECEIATNRLGRRPPERYEPLLPPLADDADDPFLKRDAALLEARGLGDSQAGSVQELDERAVAQRARHRSYGGSDEPLRLGRRERAR